MSGRGLARGMFWLCTRFMLSEILSFNLVDLRRYRSPLLLLSGSFDEGSIGRPSIQPKIEDISDVQNRSRREVDNSVGYRPEERQSKTQSLFSKGSRLIQGGLLQYTTRGFGFTITVFVFSCWFRLSQSLGVLPNPTDGESNLVCRSESMSSLCTWWRNMLWWR
jgi:hypothetical protein